MNDLVKKLVSQVNIDESTAKKVIAVVKDFLDDKLPSPIDKKVTDVLNGIDADDVGNILGKAKGLFGKK
ncbi:MAG: hypothetical protein KAH14_03410 [Clostridiales bacterium]|nr:hypothetical protein [Clostridiales bacterium]